MGTQWTDEDLFNQVLAVEQMLTSGGGWQDQVGGIVPGWKLTTTEPGMPQRFSVEQIVLAHDTSEALEEQLLLVYTGQQRVAKNILEQVVADWLSRREDMVATLTQLRSDAYLMRDALVAGDIEQFGNLLTNYWKGKKILNPETTNPTIDRMLESVADLSYGYSIAGAGGGGFLVLLAKDVRVRSEIEKRLAHTQAILYPLQVAT
jgi:fucokinase